MRRIGSGDPDVDRLLHLRNVLADYAPPMSDQEPEQDQEFGDAEPDDAVDADDEPGTVQFVTEGYGTVRNPGED